MGKCKKHVILVYTVRSKESMGNEGKWEERPELFGMQNCRSGCKSYAKIKNSICEVYEVIRVRDKVKD